MFRYANKYCKASVTYYSSLLQQEKQMVFIALIQLDKL